MSLVRYAVNHKLGYHPAFRWIRQYLNPRGEIDDDRIEQDRMAWAVRSSPMSDSYHPEASDYPLLESKDHSLYRAIILQSTNRGYFRSGNFADIDLTCLHTFLITLFSCRFLCFFLT